MEKPSKKLADMVIEMRERGADVEIILGMVVGYMGGILDEHGDRLDGLEDLIPNADYRRE